MKKLLVMKGLLTLIIVLAILPVSCQIQPTTPIVEYSLPQLEYRLIAQFGEVFWCDPDFYPIGRPEVEEKNAIEQFPIIKANTDEFNAILEYRHIPVKDDYAVEEKILIYREHKMLTRAIEMTRTDSTYRFVLRIGENQGERIEGTITTSGLIKVVNREPSINTCPICLAKDTLIDTPNGQVPVEQLQPGMAVWSVDSSGKRVAAIVEETVKTPVPASFQIVNVTLDDGRSVTASAGHPTAEVRALGDYQVGDSLDGAVIVLKEYLTYSDGATYDILPSGKTGLYWANGIPLKSTIAR
ncbi:MAG: Hint domain-containing protein [Chloroflexota bacterium]